MRYILGFVGLAVPLMPVVHFFRHRDRLPVVSVAHPQPQARHLSVSSARTGGTRRGLGLKLRVSAGFRSALRLLGGLIINTTDNPRIAVMGAVAYDVIGKTDKVFDNSGPGLNCKVTGQQEFFGGCAGNIAYGLGYRTLYLLLSAAGSEDFRRYAQHWIIS